MQFETTNKSFIGELRLHKQQRSMCVMADTSCGGGHGDVWMTEGLVYEFWVKGVHRLFRAACLNVDPANKQVHMLIYGGDTWGRYAKGNEIRLACSELQAAYRVSHHGPALVDKTAKEALKAEAVAALSDITLKELRAAVACEHEQYLCELIGKEDFLQIRDLVAEFTRLAKVVGSPGVNGYRAPSPHVFEHKQRLLSQLKRLKRGAGND
jgi:hypothetical protein